jgi:hypothetical protein
MPKLQQQAAKMTREAWEGLMRTAAFVPEEKRDWVPQGKARTLHDILAACAVLPVRWHALLLGNEPLPPPDREGYERAKAELNTLEKIKAAGDPAIERLCQLIEAVPDERLEETRDALGRDDDPGRPALYLLLEPDLSQRPGELPATAAR